MSEALLIDVGGRTRFTPGEAVEVAVGWDLPAAPDELVLGLVWSTSGRGRTNRRAAHRKRWSGGLAAAGAEVVRWEMPLGPHTHEGVLVSVGWAFRLVGPERRRVELPVVLRPAEPE